MGRSIDQEMTGIRREFVILTDPRRRGHVMPGRDTGGGTRVHQDVKVGGMNNSLYDHVLGQGKFT